MVGEKCICGQVLKYMNTLYLKYCQFNSQNRSGGEARGLDKQMCLGWWQNYEKMCVCLSAH